MAQKNVTINYGGGGVSASIYQGYNATQRQSYRTFLLSTLSNQSQYGNARWILSYEIYIPSDITVQIPKGVTLVANGGLFSGDGSIRGDDTRIEAGFEQIFEDTLNLLGKWDVTITHPEWFGIVNPAYAINPDPPYETKYIDPNNLNAFLLESRASIKIQKAIDMIYHYILWFQDSTVSRGMMFTGGRVVCKPGSMYAINDTIYLPLGISFDGGNSNFIYNCEDNRHMFYVNIGQDGEQQAGERGNSDIICNIRLINNLINNGALKYQGYGIYSANQVCTFENIYSENLVQTFKRTTHYLDQITLRNFFIINNLSTAMDLYQIDMGYIGDNLLIDNIAFDYRAKNQKLLRIAGCGGGAISRITNGTIEIISSKAISLSSVHQESGNIIIENSQIEISNFCHFKKANQPAIVIKRRAGSYENRPVLIKNGMILYNHNREPDLNIEQLDIELRDDTSVITIENIYRSVQAPWTEASSLYGIRVNNDYFMKNQGANSISSIIAGQTIYGIGVVKNNISYSIPNFEPIYLATYIGNPENEDGKDIEFAPPGHTIPRTIYQYSAAIIFDRERNIGFDSYYALTTVDTSSVASPIFVRLNFHFPYVECAVGLYIRLFRKHGSMIEYVDLPMGTPVNNLYDFGYFVSLGERWKNITNDVNRYRPQNCTAYQSWGHNAKITVDVYPTKGSWKKGDVVNYVDITPQGTRVPTYQIFTEDKNFN